MGCDTKGLVLTKFKDVMKVCALVERAVNRFILDERKARFPDARMWNKDANKQFGTMNIAIRPETEMVQMTFTFEGETRMMTMFFGCDCDHAHLGKEKIILSLGCGGRSDHIMQRALHALSMLGPAYYVYNDCSGELAPLDEYRPNLLQAIQLGYVRDCYFEDWAPLLNEYAGTAQKAGALIGLNERQAKTVLAMQDHVKQWEKISKLAAKTKAPPLACMLDYEEEMAHRQEAGELATATT